MTVIKRRIGQSEVTLSRYGKNFLSIEDIFDLETKELSSFLKKKEDAPIGNLREIYHCQSNRGLISKIARETLLSTLWLVITGKSFYFPGSSREKIFVGVMDKSASAYKRSIGKYKDMNLFMSGFRIPILQVYTCRNKKPKNTSVYVNNDLYEEIVRRLNDTGKVGGKIPLRLQTILPTIYERFSYIEEESIKLICLTFFRRLKLICSYDCDLVIKDRFNVIKFYYPRSVNKYKEISEHRKDFVTIKLREDKFKYFPCQNKLQTPLTS